MDYLEHDSIQDTPAERQRAEEFLTRQGYGAHFVHFRSVQHFALGDNTGLRTRGYRRWPQ